MLELAAIGCDALRECARDLCHWLRNLTHKET